MALEVRPETARKIKSLLTRGQRLATPKIPGSGSSRYDTHIRITGEPQEDYYPCVPCYFDPHAEAWVEFNEQLAIAANPEFALEEGMRYRAICYGQVEGYLVFAAGEPAPPVECHLRYIAGKLNVVLDEMAGDGLEVTGGGGSDSGSGSDSGCDRLKVKPDCGIKVSADGVRVDTEPNEEKEFSFTVLDDNPVSPFGCGFELATRRLVIKRNECGVFIDFELEDTEYTYVELDCGSSSDSSSDSDSDSDSGCCFEDGWYCIDGQCMYIEKGCENCDSDSDSTSEDDCAGWYCCPATGTVVYLEDCAAVEAYQCGEEDECAGYYCCGDGVMYRVDCEQTVGEDCLGPFATTEEAAAACPGNELSTGPDECTGYWCCFIDGVFQQVYYNDCVEKLADGGTGCNGPYETPIACNE